MNSKLHQFFFLDPNALCVLDFPQIFFTRNLNSANIKYSTIETAVSSTSITSREWYWKKFRSRAAERKWVAPLCLSTYSVQNTARSSGWSGWSWNRLDSSRTRSRYLQIIYRLDSMLHFVHSARSELTWDCLSLHSEHRSVSLQSASRSPKSQQNR